MPALCLGYYVKETKKNIPIINYMKLRSNNLGIMYVEVHYMYYIERIKALREDNDLNQTEVAHIIHVAQTTYSDYENGRVRFPLECLIALAKYYNVDLNYIAGISNIKHEFPKK